MDDQEIFEATTSLLLEIMMRKTNHQSGFGMLFVSGAALVSPVHEFIASKPLYGTVQPDPAARAAFYPIIRLVRVIDAWRQRQRQRRSLAMLSDRLLSDVGLTRADVERELQKPLWR